MGSRGPAQDQLNGIARSATLPYALCPGMFLASAEGLDQPLSSPWPPSSCAGERRPRPVQLAGGVAQPPAWVERDPLADDPFRTCRLVHRYFLRVAARAGCVEGPSACLLRDGESDGVLVRRSCVEHRGSEHNKHDQDERDFERYARSLACGNFTVGYSLARFARLARLCALVPHRRRQAEIEGGHSSVPMSPIPPSHKAPITSATIMLRLLPLAALRRRLSAL